MINIFENPPKSNWVNITERPTKTVDNIESIVFDIFNSVKSNGDDAIKQLTQKFDGCYLDSLSVSEVEFNTAEELISEDLKKAIS